MFSRGVVTSHITCVILLILVRCHFKTVISWQLKKKIMYVLTWSRPHSSAMNRVSLWLWLRSDTHSQCESLLCFATVKRRVRQLQGQTVVKVRRPATPILTRPPAFEHYRIGATSCERWMRMQSENSSSGAQKNLNLRSITASQLYLHDPPIH